MIPPHLPYFSWTNPDDVTRFRALADKIIAAYRPAPDAPDFGQLPDNADLSRLIQHTIELLGALRNIPEEVRDDLFISAAHLQGAWVDINERWKAGDLSDVGAALGYTRPKNWNKNSYKKHREKGPLVFAEISFEISTGKSRTEAVALMVDKYHVARSQVEAWYDEHMAEMPDDLNRSPPIERALFK